MTLRRGTEKVMEFVTGAHKVDFLFMPLAVALRLSRSRVRSYFYIKNVPPTVDGINIAYF